MRTPGHSRNVPPAPGGGLEPGEWFGELRDRFLGPFPRNTARAYRADLEHLHRWLVSFGWSFFGLTDALLLRYLRMLIVDGYSNGTVRRRITCLRAFTSHLADEGVVLGFDVDAVAGRLRGSPGTERIGSTSLVIVSDDEIIRAGLQAAAQAAGIVDMATVDLARFADRVRGLPPYDYALVHLWPATVGLDRVRGVETVSLIARQNSASTVLVLASFEPTTLVSLRLAESGCGFLVPYAEVRSDPQALFGALGAAELDTRFALPTQWAIRQSLGLRWDGEVEPFLALARTLPPEVWTTDRPQSTFALARTAFRDVQRAARDVAGLPEPSFRRYAASVRRPPELPEWPRVRSFVRGLWALPTDSTAASVAQPEAQAHNGSVRSSGAGQSKRGLEGS